jgi:hypothetical protein
VARANLTTRRGSQGYALTEPDPHLSAELECSAAPPSGDSKSPSFPLQYRFDSSGGQEHYSSRLSQTQESTAIALATHYGLISSGERVVRTFELKEMPILMAKIDL